MTDTEAFKIAHENVTKKTWVPEKFAFEQPMKVVWLECRLAQVYHYWLHTNQCEKHTEIPKTLEELKEIEEEMEFWRYENNM